MSRAQSKRTPQTAGARASARFGVRVRSAPFSSSLAKNRRCVKRAEARAPGLHIHAEIVPALLHWYRRNARDLPWRRTTDPYPIWISEIMLQQTQVKTVIPYWEKWMRALPNVQALASARIDRILKLWEGLGYYSRARNARRAAKVIVKVHGASFPKKFQELIELPGIGRYTAGAICSIAFDQRVPVLDGNVLRVLARLFAIASDPKGSLDRFWRLAQRLVVVADERRLNGERACADLNQALMELGATVCTPSSPNCPACPIQRYCIAFGRGRVQRFPLKSEKPAVTRRRFVALVVERNRRFLVRRRAANVINGGLWEFPNAEVSAGAKAGASHPHSKRWREVRASFSGAKRLECGWLASAFATTEIPGAQLNEVTRLCTIKHTITRYRITLEVVQARLSDGSAVVPGNWCTIGGLNRLAFSSAHKRIVQKLSAMTPHSAAPKQR